MHFTTQSFNELSLSELYDILALRSAVFVVEQNIVYQDIDGVDKKALHFYAREGETLAAYARLIPPGVKFPESSIGRIIVHPDHRGKGLGKKLILSAIEEIRARFGKANIVIEAQAQLEGFYQSLGFVSLSEPFMLEGLMHVRMGVGDYLPLSAPLL